MAQSAVKSAAVSRAGFARPIGPFLEVHDAAVVRETEHPQVPVFLPHRVAIAHLEPDDGIPTSTATGSATTVNGSPASSAQKARTAACPTSDSSYGERRYRMSGVNSAATAVTSPARQART